MKITRFGRRIAFFAVLFFCAGRVGYAQAASAKAGTLADLSFLEGHWKGTFNGGPIEASWMAPAGDNFAGLIRMMKDSKITMYEILVYEQTEQGPVSMVKHFKPGLMGVEEKDKSDRYRFLEGGKDRALLEKEDGSIRIIYEKRGNDQLVIQRGQQKDGQWAFSDLFVFDRAR